MRHAYHSIFFEVLLLSIFLYIHMHAMEIPSSPELDFTQWLEQEIWHATTSWDQSSPASPEVTLQASDSVPVSQEYTELKAALAARDETIKTLVTTLESMKKDILILSENMQSIKRTLSANINDVARLSELYTNLYKVNVIKSSQTLPLPPIPQRSALTLPELYSMGRKQPTENEKISIEKREGKS